MDISKAAKEFTWLKTFLRELGTLHYSMAIIIWQKFNVYAKTKHTVEVSLYQTVSR